MECPLRLLRVLDLVSSRVADGKPALFCSNGFRYDCFVFFWLPREQVE